MTTATIFDWNAIRRDHYPSYEVEREQRPVIDSIRSTPEWESVVGYYNIESWQNVTADTFLAALNLLSEITGLKMTAVAFHATREARSRELQFEYEVGLG